MLQFIETEQQQEQAKRAKCSGIFLNDSFSLTLQEAQGDFFL